MAEAWRNITAVGGRRWRSPTISISAIRSGRRSWASSSAAIRGIAEACKALDFPVVSGNVSLYNETNGRGILPTPDHRRRRPARRFHQVGDARLQGRGRSDPADRRDPWLARPVALSARHLRPRRGRAAAGRSRRREAQRRFRARADPRRHRHRGARRLRRRPPGRARRDGDGVRHRRRARCAPTAIAAARLLVRRRPGALRRHGRRQRRRDGDGAGPRRRHVRRGSSASPAAMH